MITIEYDNDDIRNLVEHRYQGIYKKFKSAATLIRDLDKVVTFMKSANSIEDLKKMRSLNYEHLKGCDRCSVRVGYSTKYRLEFYEDTDKIILTLIKLSEHYGEH